MEFKISLKNKQTIKNMNDFSLTIHAERDFPYNYIILDILKNNNILTPNYSEFNVVFNGINWGVMLMKKIFPRLFILLIKLKKPLSLKCLMKKNLDYKLCIKIRK